MDVGLVRRIEAVSRRSRDFVLVLLEGVSGLPDRELRHLTFRRFAELVQNLPKVTPYKAVLSERVRILLRARRAEDPTVGADSLIFPAHGDRTKGFEPTSEPLSRQQVWRVIKTAVQVLSKGLTRGALTALRALFTVVPPAIAPVGAVPEIECSWDPPDRTLSRRYVHFTPDEEEEFFRGMSTA